MYVVKTYAIVKKFWIFCHYFVHIVSACNVLVWTTFWFYILCVLSSLSVQDKNAGQGIAVEVNETGGKFWVEKRKENLAKKSWKIWEVLQYLFIYRSIYIHYISIFYIQSIYIYKFIFPSIAPYISTIIIGESMYPFVNLSVSVFQINLFIHPSFQGHLFQCRQPRWRGPWGGWGCTTRARCSGCRPSGSWAMGRRSRWICAWIERYIYRWINW